MRSSCDRGQLTLVGQLTFAGKHTNHTGARGRKSLNSEPGNAAG